ncbi:AAA family ATPase [Paeniglutamicibacter sp. MACA_103]|uniref:AAA family ATPase n=1 Tax=Paeniglutamicibacter sp. MACA_103 TaxID=3377337 RepID=UPI0038962060
MDQSTLMLVSASASRVLGEYDHSFSIRSSDEFAIIYGPNGVGKTKFLEIVDALSRLQGFTLSNLPFASAVLTYSDASELSVVRDSVEDEGLDAIAAPASSVRFTLKRPRQKIISWNYTDDDFAEVIRKHLPYEQVSDLMWQDPSDGEIVHVDDLRARYELRNTKRTQKRGVAPQSIQDFVKLVPSFLIETQRLRIEQMRPKPGTTRFGSNRTSTRSQSRITEQAEKIRALVNGAQTEHSRITQRLDRTFPNRMLRATSNRLQADIDPDLIRERYDAQNDFRSRLGRVASVSLDDELSLPDGDIEGWALRLLNLYLDDADEKLEPFEALLKKIELLEHIINDRLLNKELRVTDGEGLSVEHSLTGRPITLDSLSSGEQHVIILMIDLLFNVPRGAVVLIDEPEISLHVAWQMAFIPDVKRIAELAGFRFVVATHSPQIINGDWDRAIRLGPHEVAF